jgi:hypothetical protein
MTSTTCVFMPVLSSARAPVPVVSSTSTQQQQGGEEGECDGRPSWSGAPTTAGSGMPASASSTGAGDDKVARHQRRLYGVLYWRREGGSEGAGGDVGAPSFTGPEAEVMSLAARYLGLLVDASQGLDLGLG